MFANSLAPPSPARQAPATATLWLLGVLGFVAGAFAALGSPHTPARSAAVALALAQPAASASSVVTPGSPASPPSASTPPRLTGVPAPAPQATAPAGASRVRDARSTRKQLLLLALLLAAAGAAWLLARQRKGQGGGAAALRGLEVIQTLRLGGRFQVALVRAPGRLLVLGLSDKGVTLLTELDEDALPAPAAAGQLGQAGQVAERWVDQLAAGVAAPGALAPSPQLPPGPPPDAGPAYARRADGASEEAFLDTLMDRLSSATPAVIRDVLGVHAGRSAGSAAAMGRPGRARGLQRYEEALAP